MSFYQFISSFLPSFEKGLIQGDLDVVKNELTSNTLPPYRSANDYFTRNSFKSKENIEYDQLFNRNLNKNRLYFKKDKSNTTYINTVYNSLSNGIENFGLIEDLVETHFGRDVAKSGLTYSRINILKYIELNNFIAKYARKLLLWTYNNEKKSLNRTSEDPISKAEFKWLMDNRYGFIKGLEIINTKTTEIKARFLNIPDRIYVPEEEPIVLQTVGADKMDPLKMNYIPLVSNVIYSMRLRIAEYQVARYKARLEEKKALEYRLLELEELSNGNYDPGLERQIEYTESRLRKLNYRLNQMEEVEIARS